MTRRLRFILLFFFFAGTLFSQESRLLVMGRVISAKDSVSGIDGVVITCNAPQRQTHSNKDGYYSLLLDYKTGQVITYRIIGSKTEYRTITKKMLDRAGGDTLRLDVYLSPDLITLPLAEVKSGPDTVLGNNKFFIEDYMFYDEHCFILLTFEKSLKSAKVMLTDDHQAILSSFDVPGEAIELYKDYQGNINVMCRDSAFRVKVVQPAEVLLLALPYKDFCERMLPCVDTVGSRILFTNYMRDYPAFSYFSYNPADTTVEPVHYIVDKELLAQYNWEFDYLLPKDRLYARKMEMYTGIDKRIIAATMTGFPQSIYYTPLYAPLFVVHDTVCVFDHYSDTLFLFDKFNRSIGASHIDYHHPKNWKEWDRQMLQDDVTGDIYAQFEKGGFYYLKRIDIKTGKVTGTYKLQNQYVKHIRVHDGEVYYIYRPFESVQTKFLYREKMELS
ncbi:MAG TPA: hypothetical protein VFU15_07700 [Bacteroidia bacterium]|nr:hypothetical protein [Bacteroidia bacterium]